MLKEAYKLHGKVDPARMKVTYVRRRRIASSNWNHPIIHGVAKGKVRDG